MNKNYVLLFLFAFNLAYAQWDTNSAINNPVCIQAFSQVDSKIVSDLKGGSIIVWEDYRNDATLTKADIYAQRLDANGNIKWQSNGITVCNDIAHQNGMTLVSDGAGGALIAWQDRRGLKRNIYAQRIDSSGNALWAANGVGVTLRNADQQKPRIINNGNNGAVIVWMDSSATGEDIFGQQLDLNGAQLWPNGVNICSNQLVQSNPRANISSAGEIFVTWQDKRNGNDYDIYMQKLNLSGAAQWTVDGIVVCSIAENQTNPKLALDNTGGVIAIWQDKRNALDNDIYAQRIDNAGVTQWTVNGISVCALNGSQQTNPDITSTNVLNGAYIVWKDLRNGATNADIYAQKINLTGTVQWAANGISVTNAPLNQQAPNATTDGSGGLIVSYEDTCCGSWDVKSQRIDNAGNKLWAANGVSVGSAIGDQNNQDHIALANGESIYVFEDTRSGNIDLYAYKLNANGTSTRLNNLKSNSTFIVYPNPSNGIIHFKLNAVSKKLSLKIFDTNIKEIVSEEIFDSNQFDLNKKLQSGLYYYSIEINNKTTYGKIVVLQ
jgi:Secretion system C-terminal sorting domain